MKQNPYMHPLSAIVLAASMDRFMKTNDEDPASNGVCIHGKQQHEDCPDCAWSESYPVAQHGQMVEWS